MGTKILEICYSWTAARVLNRDKPNMMLLLIHMINTIHGSSLEGNHIGARSCSVFQLRNLLWKQAGRTRGRPRWNSEEACLSRYTCSPVLASRLSSFFGWYWLVFGWYMLLVFHFSFVFSLIQFCRGCCAVTPAYLALSFWTPLFCTFFELLLDSCWYLVVFGGWTREWRLKNLAFPCSYGLYCSKQR